MKAKQMELMVDKSVESLTARVNARLADGWEFLPGFKANEGLTRFVIVTWQPLPVESVEISRVAGSAVS